MYTAANPPTTCVSAVEKDSMKHITASPTWPTSGASAPSERDLRWHDPWSRVTRRRSREQDKRETDEDWPTVRFSHPSFRPLPDFAEANVYSVELCLREGKRCYIPATRSPCFRISSSLRCLVWMFRQSERRFQYRPPSRCSMILFILFIFVSIWLPCGWQEVKIHEIQFLFIFFIFYFYLSPISLTELTRLTRR